MSLYATAKRTLSRLLERRTAFGDMLRLRGFGGLRGTIATSSGQAVNEDSALKLAAVFASIKIIAETKASLPQRVYEITKSGSRVETTQHDVAGLLQFEPHPWSTPMVFDETRIGHLLGWGNCYSEITLNPRTGRVERLTTHHPANVTPYIDTTTGDVLYQVRSVIDGNRTLDRSQMLHVAGFGPDGLIGLSPIRMFANAIGTALAADRLVALHFNNKALPGITISTPHSLGDKREAFVRHIRESVGGDNVFSPLVLEGGMTAQVHTIPLDEALLVTAREFQGKEIVCRCYRIPPHIAGYMDSSTNNNISAQDLAFEKHTMRPWLIRDEQEKNRKLFKPSERGRFYIKHDVADLLRGDMQARFEAYKTGILCGIITRNEVRDWEDLNPIDGGDEALLPQAIFGKAGTDPSQQQVSQTGAQPKAT